MKKWEVVRDISRQDIIDWTIQIIMIICEYVINKCRGYTSDSCGTGNQWKKSITAQNIHTLQGSSTLCSWLSLRFLMPWINHMPPVFWSTFWNIVLNDSWFVSSTERQTFFIIFIALYAYVFVYILISYSINTCRSLFLDYFASQIVLYFCYIQLYSPSP